MGGFRWLDVLFLSGNNNVTASVGPQLAHTSCFSATIPNHRQPSRDMEWEFTYATSALGKNLQSLGDRFIINVLSTDFGIASGGQLRVYTDATHFSTATLLSHRLSPPRTGHYRAVQRFVVLSTGLM